MAVILVGIYSPFAAWNIPVAHVERLRAEFPGHTFLHAHDDGEAAELMASATIAFMSEVRPNQFAAGAQLEWIHSPAAGIGGMLFPAMLDSPVVMSNSRGISANTIAEHVVGMTLAMFRKLPQAVRSQSAREWAQDAIMHGRPIRMLAGSRILVVGLGSIGAATARRFAALQAEVTGIRRNWSRPTPEGVSAVHGPEALETELASADVVVRSAPQTSGTRGLIGAAALAAMKSDALLVNVSRGRLVDENALIEALRNGVIGGAALDVFEHEPLAADSPLWDMPNVLITPHMSGFRPDHWDAVTDLFADNLHRFLKGQPLLNVVNKQEGY